jgi:hypothetical protein
MESTTINRREPDAPADRRKFDEPVTIKVLVGVVTSILVAFFIWSATIASSSVVSTPRFERDSARRDFRDSMRSRDMQDIRNDVKCIRAVVAKSITASEVCR